MMDSKLCVSKNRREEQIAYRMTEKRREEIAAAAIVARMTTLSSDSTFSNVCGDIFVRTDSIVPIAPNGLPFLHRQQKGKISRKTRPSDNTPQGES